VDGLFSSKELYAVDNLYLVYGLRNDRIFWLPSNTFYFNFTKRLAPPKILFYSSKIR
jgi:hypothetical protein